ncbi:uncharacterized protein [Magallana gigas]|uniref:uncharacterized protein n=1 Tax=Magallana gigas TaxID=29159 RepID=UPI00334203B2
MVQLIVVSKLSRFPPISYLFSKRIVFIHVCKTDMTANWIPILVLYVSQHILACDDVSISACQKFAAQNPAMCHDGSCYATLCPRTCHKCASLKCFSCGTVARPEMCNTTIECPSKDFDCIIAKSFTHDFREEFALGCALRSVCDSHNNGMSCCSTDLCNNNQPTTARKLPIRRENKDKAVRQTATSCSDIHEDGCRDLLSTDPNICDTTCAKTLCPVTCGSCKQCYDCEFVSDSSHCTSKRVCQPGEYCYRIEAVSANFEHGFRLGCATDILCSKLTSIALNVFGRKRSVAGDCCHGNLCNDHIKTVTTTTMMATTQPTTKRTTTRTTSKHHSSCPCAGTDHFQVNNECFFVSSSHGTRQQGKDYCISHCGQLAAFTDESQLETVRHRIYSSSHFHNHHFDHMFVDAVKHHKSHTHPTYIWESTGRTVPTIFLRHRNNTATYNDMCAVTSGVHSTHIQSESCSANRYALCQLR